MATKTKTDSLTIQAAPVEEGPKETMVRIFLPKLEDSGDNGVSVDQYEHVTISNEEKDKTYYILRGEWVEVPVNVFIILKQKYPNL